MPSNAQIDAPLTLMGLFPPDSSDDDDEEEEEDDHDAASAAAEDNNGCLYEIQTMNLVGKDLQVRQYDYHSHNANQVWPGTFNLAEYLLIQQQQDWGHILELGTATGILAIRLACACRSIVQQQRLCTADEKNGININNNNTKDAATAADDDCCCSSITTSDVCDEGNQIEHNVRYNINLNRNVILDRNATGDNNNNDNDPCPIKINIPHIPHTWGTGWKASVMKRQQQKLQEGLVLVEENEKDASISSSSPQLSLQTLEFDTIIASDILLYVSAYPSLVKTLQELMPLPIVPDDIIDDNIEEEGVVTINQDDGSNSICNVDDEDCTAFVWSKEQQQQETISSNKKKKKKKMITPRFVMSWNRRMKESAEFFQLMNDAGFDCHHEGKCIYTFTRTRNYTF